MPDPPIPRDPPKSTTKGRVKTKRIQSALELHPKKKNKCSYCSYVDHNLALCPARLVWKRTPWRMREGVDVACKVRDLRSTMALNFSVPKTTHDPESFWILAYSVVIWLNHVKQRSCLAGMDYCITFTMHATSVAYSCKLQYCVKQLVEVLLKV